MQLPVRAWRLLKVLSGVLLLGASEGQHLVIAGPGAGRLHLLGQSTLEEHCSSAEGICKASTRFAGKPLHDPSMARSSQAQITISQT